MMNRLAVSNIAWPAEEDDAALDLVAGLGFSGVEIAPAKVFGSLDAATGQAAAAYRKTVEARGLRIAAMQGLLFGLPGVHLFADDAQRTAMAQRLIQIAVLAGHLGGVACVFGAPKLRDPGDMDPGRAMDIATRFFRALAPAFSDNNSVLAFEANPAAYGCRFITHTSEALALVDRVAAPGFRLQFDTGTAFINGEDFDEMRTASSRAAHLHISEPDLAPIGSALDHRAFAAALKTSSYKGRISLEMRAVPADWRTNLMAAAKIARLYVTS
jgi:sugar phosphate isomerase/epimerase